MSLGRLWQQQGKSAEARQLMQAIYGGFREGFDTTDLQEAKAFVQELEVEERHTTLSLVRPGECARLVVLARPGQRHHQRGGGGAAERR